jgi:hypothetical protein
MKKLICLFALPILFSGCAGTPQIQGVQGVAIDGITRVKVGETSVLLAPQKRISNGVVFVMEDGNTYWSKRYIENNEVIRLLQNDKNVDRWVHLSPVSEGDIRQGDVVLTCVNRQLYYLRY